MAENEATAHEIAQAFEIARACGADYQDLVHDGSRFEVIMTGEQLALFARKLLAPADPPVAYVTAEDFGRLQSDKWVSVEATPMGFDVPSVPLYARPASPPRGTP